MRDIVKKDKAYKDWVLEVSERFRQSQIKAAVKVNDEMLRFYWGLGRDLEKKRTEYVWGSHFFSTISKDLTDHLPEVKSFSPRNLLYMNQFFRLFPTAIVDSYSEGVDDVSDISITQQAVAQLEDQSTQQTVAQNQRMDYVFLIPWGHIVRILDKCGDDQEKALFYIGKTFENNWSRAVLLNFLDTNLYEREGKAISNFGKTLPRVQGDLAQAITKDPYNFDFLTIREKYDEKQLKDALMTNIIDFLLELGSGFTFVGREVKLDIGDKENYLDLLFYHLKLRCYVVLEVKVTDFDSSYAGKLGTYVVAVNHQLKTEQDNPTIGLLVCKGMNKVEAGYALESTSQPIGISGYELSKLIPEEFKGDLPTIEEIEAELDEF